MAAERVLPGDGMKLGDSDFNSLVDSLIGPRDAKLEGNDPGGAEGVDDLRLLPLKQPA
jgi:hypothetical protein